MEFPPWISEHAKSLILKILVQDPNKRIDIKGLKKSKIYENGQRQYLIKQARNRKNKSLLTGGTENYFTSRLPERDERENMKSEANIMMSDFNIFRQKNKETKVKKNYNFPEPASLTKKYSDLFKTTNNKRNNTQNKENKRTYPSKTKKFDFLSFLNSTTSNSPTRTNSNILDIKKGNTTSRPSSHIIDFRALDGKRNHHPKITLNEFNNFGERHERHESNNLRTNRMNKYFNLNLKTKTDNVNYNSINNILDSTKLLRMVHSGRTTNRGNYRTNSLTNRELKNVTEGTYNFTSKLFSKDFGKTKKNNNNFRKAGITIHLKSQGNSIEKNRFFYEPKKKIVPTLI